VAAETGGVLVPADDASDLLGACLEVFSQVKDRTVMGSGEVTMPVMVSATVGLQKRTYFEMHYTVMFDDGQTARGHVTEVGCLLTADLCSAHLWPG